MENIRKIEEIKAALEALAEARKEYSGKTAMRAALRQALNNKNTQASAKLWDTDIKSFRKTVKAAITGGNRVGDVRNITRLLSISNYDELIQDYLPQIILSSAGGVNATYWQHDEVAPASIVNEAANKPENAVRLQSTTTGLIKMAISEVVSLEALMSVGFEELLDALEALLLLRIEDGIHDYIITQFLSNSVAFDTTPYAQSVMYANYIDTLYLAIQQERRVQVYESDRVKSDVDLVVMPTKFYERIGVLKDAVGRRLYNSYKEAFGDDVNTLRYTSNAQNLQNIAFVARSNEIKLAVMDTAYVVLQPESPIKNTYRLVCDVFFNLRPTPRVEGGSKWYVRSTNLVTDTQAINIPQQQS